MNLYLKTNKHSYLNSSKILKTTIKRLQFVCRFYWYFDKIIRFYKIILYILKEICNYVQYSEYEMIETKP